MNAIVLAKTKGMERDEWLRYRTHGIGGSDAAAVAGLNPWKSPVDVWLEKTGMVSPPDLDEMNEAAYWGTVLEDLIAKEFTRQTGLKVRRRNAILRHPDYPFMIADVDRLITSPDEGTGVLEVKTTSAWARDQWDGDRVPDHYMIQLQHYLAVTGCKWGYMAVLIGGQTYKHVRVERDDELINYLVQIEAEFWRLVESQTPPVYDGSEASSEVLKRLYPKGRPEQITLPDEALTLIEQYEEAAKAEKVAKARKEAAANQLKGLLGEYEVGVVGGRIVTWKTVVSRKLDEQRLAADHPDLAERYMVDSSYRRFGIK